MSKPLVVITGASEGIGKALAIKYSDEGHPCLLISRHIEPIEELKDREVIYQQLDVVDYAAFKDAVTVAEEKYGSTACLINSAGFINVGDFAQMDIEKSAYEIDVLIKGVLNGIKVVLGDMESRRSGTIINISSVGDRKPSEGAVGYHASKHAVRSMGESLNQAEAKHNVRLMNVAPGLVKTNIHAHMGISFEEYCERLGNPTFIMPEELAEVVWFCWQLPQHICVRDIEIMPTDCAF